MDREIRSINIVDAELRAARRGRLIEGRAIVFNSESRDLGGFTEVILPEAVDEILATSDVVALFNHSLDRGVLARYTNGEGTLELWKDERGVNYRFEAPDTPLGDEVLSGIRRGDIRTSSFAFICRDDNNQSWEKKPDGTWHRTIKKIEKLFDVSPVVFEAYQDTTVATRNLVDVRTREAESLRLEAEKELETLRAKAEKSADPEDAPASAEEAPAPTAEVEKPEKPPKEYYERLIKKIPKK